MPSQHSPFRRPALLALLAIALPLATQPSVAATEPNTSLELLAGETTVYFESREALDRELESAGIVGHVSVVQAVEFRPASHAEEYYFSFGDGYVRGADRACLMAPVHLPDGATTAGVMAYLYDDDTADIYVTLWRKAIASDYPAEPLAFLTSDGQSPTTRIAATWSVERSPIDNESFVYYLSTCLESEEHRLNAVQIEYRTP